MKALTVCQPWAWWIMSGGKRVENRKRRMAHRGPLVIHAGKSKCFHGTDDEILAPDPTIVRPPVEEMPHQVLLGLVDVLDCLHFDEMDSNSVPLDQQQFCSGPFCIIIGNPRLFPEPIPWCGKQWLWTVPDEVIPADLRA